MQFRSLLLALAAPASMALGTEPVQAQSADAALSALPEVQRAWVNRSCPRTLGPALWTSCVNREVAALRSGAPNFSGLSEEHQAWLSRSCPTALGPSLTFSCIRREVAALRMGMPKLDGLSADSRTWIQQSCPQSLGPSLYRSCVARELQAVAGTGSESPVARPPRSSIGSVPIPRARIGRRADTYSIEVSHNDELFVINGEKFEAKTYCFNMEEGDDVLFLDGSPFGACASATLLNLRTREKCEVWCE